MKSVSDDESTSEPPFPPAQRALVNAFHRVHEAAIEDHDILCDFHGSTCITFIVEEEYVHVGYVGDSRAIVIEIVECQNKADETTTTENPTLQR